jgi:hypothetical protein
MAVVLDAVKNDLVMSTGVPTTMDVPENLKATMYRAVMLLS